MSVSVNYNSYSLPNVFGKFYYAHDYKTVTFRCNFLVTSTSASGLVSACETAEVALRQPFNSLTVQFGGSTDYSLSHSSNTALNPQASVSKIESDLATETSRPYQFQYTAGLPADKSGFNFRQDHNFTVDYAATGIRTVSFHLIYTAGGENTSLVNFNTHAPAYVAAILVTLGGTYNLIGKKTDTDDQDKYTSGHFVYKEITEDEKTGARDDARLVNVQATYVRNLEQEIGISSAGYAQDPGVSLTVSYSCEVDKTQITDAKNIEAVWRTEILPFLIARAKQMLSISAMPNASSQTFIVESDQYQVDPYSFTVSGRINIRTPKTESSIISLTERIEEIFETGRSYAKIWDKKADTYAEYIMGSTRKIVRVITITKLGTRAAPPPTLTGNLRLTGFNSSHEVKRIGAGADGLISSEDTIFSVEVHSSSFAEQYLKIDLQNSVLVSIPVPVITTLGVLA